MLDLAIRSLCILGKSRFQSSRGKTEVKSPPKASFSEISKDLKVDEQREAGSELNRIQV